MYEIKVSIDGIIQTMNVSSNNPTAIHQAVTNMFGTGSFQIIDVRRI